MHRVVGSLVVIAMMFCARARADDVSVAPPSVQPTACASPTADSLFARIPETARTEFFLVPPAATDEGVTRHYEDRPPRVLEAELDGAGSREAVLLLEAIHSGEPSVSGAFVFQCRAAAWVFVDRVVLDIDWAWDGTIEGPPGFSSVTSETIAGVGHELLRIEHVDLRGGVDPRFLRHRVVLVHVVDGALVTALDVITSELIMGGPERDTISETTRTLRVRPGRTPRYRFVFTSSEEQPRRRRSCSTWLTYDGRTFVPRDAGCASR